jgi:hypothetical protein
VRRLQYSSYNWFDLEFLPQINEQFRHYYNLEKELQEKLPQNNSGGFVAMTASYFLNL